MSKLQPSTETVKHTPGPWEYTAKLTASENHKGFFIRAEKPARNGKWALAEVQPGDEDGKLGKANAALIAAAPDLLAELEDLVGLAETAMREANNDGGEYDIEAELASARDAIKKAKG